MTRRIVPLVMVAAVAAVFVCAAVSRSPRARPKAPWQRCQVNLMQIKVAKEMWASDIGTNGNPGWEDLRPYLLRLGYTNGQPICPEGGVYGVEALNGAPRCSLGKSHSIP